MQLVILKIALFVCINYMLAEALLASNKSIMTGKIKYVCAMFREKNYVFDDLLMPNILTFCTCAVIHISWYITAQRCFVDEDWFVTVIKYPFQNVLPKEIHNIDKIVTQNELTLVKVQPNFNTEPVQIAYTHIPSTTICNLLGLSTPDDKPIKGHPNLLLYKVWHVQGDLLQTKIKALYFKICKEKFNNSLTEYKRQITTSTLCISPLKNQHVEPCSFDRGAPIICKNKLQAILVYDRPIPKGLPIHLPAGCYGNIDQSISIYAESITMKYARWINKTIS